MNGVKKMRYGLIGAAATGLAIVAGLMFAGQAFGQGGPSVGIDDANGQPGESVTVDLVANVPDGLGAWTVDITYDTDQVTPTDCDGGDANSVCNTDFSPTQVRVTGASAQGIDSETVLSSITFEIDSGLDCADVDSALSLDLNVFADATIGAPADISGDTDVSDGSITCTEATEEPTAAPTLPPTGSFGGGSSDGMGLAWLLVAMAGAGLAGVAGYSALRVRTRA